jgi:hypothetical protein
MAKPKPEIIIPTEAEIPALRDRVADLNTQIASLASERDGIEARLKAYALNHPDQQESLKDNKREGRKVSFIGPRGTVNVVIASDLIIGSFPGNGVKHKQLLNILCGEHNENEATAEATLKLFFNEPAKWENRYDSGVKFRAAVAEHLGSKMAVKFIAACTQVDKFGVKKNTVSIDYKGSAAPADGEEGA